MRKNQEFEFIFMYDNPTFHQMSDIYVHVYVYEKERRTVLGKSPGLQISHGLAWNMEEILSDSTYLESDKPTYKEVCIGKFPHEFMMSWQAFVQVDS
jgi:hypothetical protein